MVCCNMRFTSYLERFIFNTVLDIQRVVRLIAIDTTAAGLNVPLTRQQFFRDFDHNIFHIPRVKFPQIDYLPL